MTVLRLGAATLLLLTAAACGETTPAASTAEKPAAADAGESAAARPLPDDVDGLIKEAARLEREALATYDRSLEARTKAGEVYLRENARKEGVTTTPSGLQYKVITPGRPDGKKPEPTSEITITYRGTFVDGQEFDASAEPVALPLNRLIRGWQEARPMMSEGATWQIAVPYSLAYGEQGRPGMPPKSTLLFDITLVSVGEAAAAPAPAPQPEGQPATPPEGQPATPPAPQPTP